MKKLLFLDLETTGLYPNVHAIWQVAGTIVIDGMVEYNLDIKTAPFKSDKLDKAALKIGNVTEEEVRSFQHPEIAQEEFVGVLEAYVDKFNKLDKFTLIGYNILKFDDPFLRAWFRKCKDRYYGSYFWWPPIDVAVLAAWDIGEGRSSFKNFKLSTVAEHYIGPLEDNKFHDAKFDVLTTRRIFNQICHNNPKVPL